MEEDYRLVSIEIEGFRGFNDAQSFSTTGDGVFAFGDQGTGKSSFLGAIEWCLFGDLAYFKSVESKTQAELVNQHHPESRCHVKTILEKPGDRMEVEREKEARSRSSHLIVRDADGEFEGDAGQGQVFLRLGLTFEDFYRSVHLHQESIRGLLTDKPEERDEAFDRLLGLDDARNILSALPLGDIRKAVQEARNGKEKAEAKLQGAASQVEETVKKAEANAQELGIPPEGCTIEGTSEMLTRIPLELREVGRETGIPQPELGVLHSWQELENGLKMVRKFIRDCRQHLVRSEEIQALTGQRAKLLDLRDRAASLEDRKRGVEVKRAAWEKDHGEIPLARSRLEELRVGLVSLENRRGQTAALTRVLGDALEYFETYRGDRCPVCGQAIEASSVAATLSESAGVNVDATARAIEENIASARGEERALAQALEDRESLELERERIDELWRDLMAETTAQVPASESQNVKSILAAEIVAVETRLGSVATAHQSREKALDSAEDEMEKPKAVLQVLVAKDAYGRLNETLGADTGQIQAAERQLKDLIDLEQRLRAIADALTAVQIRRSKELISRAEGELGRLYGVLSGHPYYSQVRIDVLPRSVAGKVKNTYIIRGVNPKENLETYVASRYSTGQMNCAALSLFLSLTKSARHRVGFLLLDDPSQSLDTQHKKALADVLIELLGARQIVVASQDREFQEFLRDAARDGRSVISYKFQGWTKTGPLVQAA